MSNICFKGQSGFELQENESIRIDSEGNISISRTYAGEYTYLSGFLSTWPVGTAHPTYTDATVSGVDQNVSGGLCTVVLTFTGKETATYTGSATLVGRSRQERSTIITVDGNEYNVTYAAPSATVTYIANDDPTRPEKDDATGMSASDTTNFPVVIFSASKVDSNAPDPTTPLSGFFTVDTDYEIERVATGFQTSPLGGGRWNVTEVWELKIKQLNPAA